MKDSRELMTPSEDSKDAVVTFAMFHFESLREQGYSVAQAKELTADMLREVYDYYNEQGNVGAKPLPLSAKKQVDDLVEMTKSTPANHAMYAVHNRLIQLQAQLNKMR